MDGISANAVAEQSVRPLVVHWAGMKQARLSAMIGADVLRSFEEFYYSRLPWRMVLRKARSIRYPLDTAQHDLKVRIRLRLSHRLNIA
jgi:hypothetical protein